MKPTIHLRTGYGYGYGLATTHLYADEGVAA